MKGLAVILYTGRETTMKDARIIELFWQRDETALTEVENKYANYCLAIAWKILMSREDSEECVNDTWLAAWNTIPPKRPSVLTSFLGRITRNFAIDKLRKKYAAKRMDMHMKHVEDILREVEALNGQTARLLENTEAEEELVRLLNEFLQTLKERDRDIFLRRYWHMDSMAELAKRHNMSESAVKSNLFRTRKKLETIMRKENYLK